jgi:hypothetical protein
MEALTKPPLPPNKAQGGTPTQRRQQSPTSASNSNAINGKIDPARLYKSIRDALTPAAFETFAGTVSRFNNGAISASETVLATGRLLGRGALADDMTRLILDAVRDGGNTA